MSVRQGAAPAQTVDAMLQGAVAGMVAPEGAAAHDPLGEGNSYATANPEHPLRRNLAVSISASLNDLCLQKNKGVWAPTQEALRNMFQQRKFTSLDGASEASGDLKSVVLHSLEVKHAKSTFPLALGTKITAVDDCTYAATGEAFSSVLLPQSESTTSQMLQQDDVSLAYEFAKKFVSRARAPCPALRPASALPPHPGTLRRDRLSVTCAARLHEREPQREGHPRGVAAPLRAGRGRPPHRCNVGALNRRPAPRRGPTANRMRWRAQSAISENADKLQVGEISMMPEGLVKMSQQLYESILPLVRTQVASQIKVRDFSRTQVSVFPAEHASWQDARAELMLEAKKPLKAQMAAELSAAPESEHEAIRLEFEGRERAIEHEVDHKPLRVEMLLGVDYKCAAAPFAHFASSSNRRSPACRLCGAQLPVEVSSRPASGRVPRLLLLPHSGSVCSTVRVTL